MDDFEVTTLGELGADRPAAFATGPFGSAVSAKNFVPNGVPMLRGSNLSEDVGVRLDESDLVFVPEELARQYSRSIVVHGDLVFTCWGTVCQIGILDGGSRFDSYLVSNKQMKMTVNDRRVIPLYLYYFLSQRSMKELVRGQAIGSSVPGFNLAQLKTLPVRLTDLRTQHATVDVLGALDDKIAGNERVVAGIDRLTAAKYEAALQSGCQDLPLEGLAAFHNRRRVPLSSRERGARRGSIPYYGAAGRLDFVDEALFDEPLLLVGEDGSVVNDDGSPVVQYIWGPSWVNNHAHVLTGDGIATETLRCALSRSNVTHLVTGAVQPKIGMGNLKKLVLRVPSEPAPFDEMAVNFAAVTRAVTDENNALASARDELLPLLMSGKARVKDAEAVVSDVV
jgi:type I restriction enzyme S subunit